MERKEYIREIENMQNRVNRIDKIMPKLKIGDSLYFTDPYDGAFEQKVTAIIDMENGIVEIIEEGSEWRRKTDIDSLSTYDEAYEYMKRMGDKMRGRKKSDKKYE